MVEPFAAVVFNSLLSSRSTLKYPSSLTSAARIMASSPRSPVTSDFFTPQPRRVKGKGKAAAFSDHPCHLSLCQEWSGCDRRHSFWCSHASRVLMLEELAPNQARLPRRYTNQRTQQPSGPRPFVGRTLAYSLHGCQRRHVSRVSEVTDSRPAATLACAESVASVSRSTSSPDPKAAAVQRFHSVSQSFVDNCDLDATWDAYTSMVNYDAISSVALDVLLAFSDRLTIAVEKHYQRDTDIEIIHDWGQRIKGILEALGPRIALSSSFDHWRRCLLARSMALLGDLQQATSLVHAADKIPLVYEDKGGILRVYEAIIMSTWRHHDSTHVLEFITLEWLFIGSHLTKKSSRWHHSTPAIMGRSLRQTVHTIIASIEHPVVALADRTGWDKERRQRMGNLLIEVLCDQRLPSDALDVFHEMSRQHLATPVGLQLTLVRALARDDAFDAANKLYSSIATESTFKYHMSTGLYLYAHQGNSIQAEIYYNDLADHSWANEYDIAMLLYSYTTMGRVEPAVALFNDFFPEGPGGMRQNFPTILHYSIIIYGYAQRGDFQGINVWLEFISQAGLTPDAYVYTIILRSFALRGDMDSVAAVLAQMRAAGIQPNVVSYTTVITLLAHRKDPVGAEAIYKRAIQEGVVPDRRMISSVMNAHVEAGSWKGVIRAFDYLKSSPTRHIRLTIEVYNTLLKAYVLIGAPFRLVSALFTKLEKSKIKPDAYTFALLIQSACDAGKMNLASDIFHEMDRLGEGQQSSLHINAYVLTIIMAGFLRTGDKIRAKAAYDDMRDRGIQPTHISFGTILKAYGNERTQESMKIAEDFIRSLMRGPSEDRVWDKPTHGRKSALDHVYGPVINAYAKQQKIEDVERVFQDMLDAGGVPSLGILATLLDAYRRTFNIDAVLQLWPQIYHLGLQYSREDGLFEGEGSDPTRSRLQANILCVPLSIYIDALSAAGLHTEIAAVWKQFQTHGFSFDSHNWNHLVVALVRAGEPERAFEVIEKVILPYQRQSERLHRSRDMNPNTPLTFDETSSSDETSSPDTPSEGPMHRPTHRATAIKVATNRLPNLEIDDEEYDSDFAHPLHILHQISPSWATWRPHNTSLTVLLMVLSRLQSGSLIEPVTTVDNDLKEPHADSERSLKAREMLRRIYKNYPDTIHALLNHEVVERRRLGGDYDMTYNWR